MVGSKERTLEEELFLDLDDVDLDSYAEIRHELQTPASYTSKLMDFFESDPNESGCFLPFPSSSGLRFRGGEVTLWSGQNFHGKSALLTQGMLYFLRDGYSDKKEKFLVISPEFDPMRNIARWVQQIVAKVFFYSHVGIV